MLVDENVLWFQVAVYDFLSVQVAESGHNLGAVELGQVVGQLLCEASEERRAHLACEACG